MRLFSLAFLLGVLLLQNFSFLPAEKWVWASLMILPLTVVIYKNTYLKIACVLTSGILCGFCWCLYFAHAQITWELPSDFEGKTVSAIGYVTSIPDASQHRTEFLFKVKKLQLENASYNQAALVHLTWQGWNVPALHVGDKWQLSIRLKKIHSTLNPGGFDYEARALEEGVRAHGYVFIKGENTLLQKRWNHHPLDRMREYLKNKIEVNLPVTNTSPWIIALVLGERQGISEENWEVLRNTGTNHLMAIAGLHIGFMSGLAYCMFGWIWRRVPRLAVKFPAQHAGAIAALLMALLYSAMAGFSLPTQRACLMLSMFLVIHLCRREILAWYAWNVALLIVLLINPLTVQTESFWLSFGAVALIIYGVSGRLSPQGLWWKWGRLQWVIGFGLIPFSIWLFQQCSTVSFVANSIAIPWVGCLVVPLSLLGSFLLLISVKVGAPLLILADKLLSLLWMILTWFSHFSWAAWFHVISNVWILIAACIGMILLLLPAGFPGRWFGVIGLLPLFFYQPASPKLGQVWFTLLDVGQGLSSVVQTQNHVLVFDTGAKLGPGFDMGESVVVPFLRTLGVKRLDMLVVSHGDNDHIGGAPAILKHFKTNSVKTSVPEELKTANTSYCLRGEKWNWDGVYFEFLYPASDTLGFDNDSSCVLRITAGDKHILLTGDIEKFAEKNLVTYEPGNLATDILVAPHHGSKTSAEDRFLQAVHPMYVLYPIGYRNRYHFPNQIVIDKYTALGTKQLDTANAGAIEFEINPNTKIAEPISYRVLHRKYWNS